MLRLIGLLCMVFGSAAFTHAQQDVSATGGNTISSAGSAGIAEGQPNYTSFIGSSGTAAEGIPKPFEIHVLNKPDPANAITLKYEINANPAADILILLVQRDQFENIKYQLLDMSGKVLEEAFVGDVETSISLKPYRSTDYFLKVTENFQEVIIFKIAKINKL